NANVSQLTAERAELMAINTEEKGIALSTEIYEVPKATAAARGLRPLPVAPFAVGVQVGKRHRDEQKHPQHITQIGREEHHRVALGNPQVKRSIKRQACLPI
ncbi:MAG: hypothetical protein O7G32_11830, partial [SAR324 cluster bacterium]|nr:hypothetical protein [SAR324 cluster bacterium]